MWFLVFLVTKFLLTSRDKTAEAILMLFDSPDANPRLLHSYRDKIAKKFIFHHFTPKGV